MGKFLGKYEVFSEETENLSRNGNQSPYPSQKGALHQDSLQMSSFKGQIILTYIFLEKNTRGKATCFILRDRCQFGAKSGSGQQKGRK